MKERTLRIGKPTPLIGVATEPDQFVSARPAVLILNSGIMHHVGSCRMSVRLARAVAAKGLLAVRYDYSGIGDSEPRRGSESFLDVSLTECAEVMDYLQKTWGVSHFILYGLCSGADASFHTALADNRVVAISQFDPYSYMTRRYYVEHYWPILVNGTRWKSFLANRWQQLTAPTERQGPSDAAGIDEQYFEIPTYTRVFPPREEVARGLRKLVARGVRIQVNFPLGPDYNYRGQFMDSFPDVNFGGLLQANFYRNANHVVTQPTVQAAVIRDVAEWIAEVAHCVTPSNQTNVA